MGKIEKMITEIDVPGPFSGTPLVVPVQNADPNQLVAALNVGYSRGPKGPLAQFAVNGQSILVQAPESIRADIAELIKSMDVPGGNSEVKCYKLDRGDAQTLEPVFRNMLMAGVRPGAEMQVNADPRTNCLVVAAPHVVQSIAEQLVADLDRKPEDETITQVVPLTVAQAADVAKALQDSSISKGPAGQPGGAASTRVRVSALQSSNAILLSGPKADVGKALALIKDFEQVGLEAGSATHTYPLKNADAVDVAKFVEKMYPAAQGKEGLKAFADERTNTLMVGGPAGRFVELDKVIKLMDTDETGSSKKDMDIVAVPLARGDADDIAYKVQDKLDLIYGKQSPLVEGESSTNTIYVTGKKEQFPKAQELIKMLEKTALPPKRIIRVRHTKVPSDQLLKALQEYAPQYLRGSVHIEQTGSTQTGPRPEDSIIELQPTIRQKKMFDVPATQPTSDKTSGKSSDKAGRPSLSCQPCRPWRR